jgi:hypothetical protein
MADEPKRGFACGSNAADAARKNHEMGTAHRWSPRQAKKNSLKAIRSPRHPRFTRRKVAS